MARHSSINLRVSTFFCVPIEKAEKLNFFCRHDLMQSYHKWHVA